MPSLCTAVSCSDRGLLFFPFQRRPSPSRLRRRAEMRLAATRYAREARRRFARGSPSSALRSLAVPRTASAASLCCGSDQRRRSPASRSAARTTRSMACGGRLSQWRCSITTSPCARRCSPTTLTRKVVQMQTRLEPSASWAWPSVCLSWPARCWPRRSSRATSRRCASPQRSRSSPRPSSCCCPRPPSRRLPSAPSTRRRTAAPSRPTGSARVARRRLWASSRCRCCARGGRRSSWRCGCSWPSRSTCSCPCGRCRSESVSILARATTRSSWGWLG
mmetsp:Transcript_60077/g.137746  ORF Transcript_60077/g.137746 Transcript_60077/m.137746 type:complete len:277 (+) Transcript_60077:197-1027(+)